MKLFALMLLGVLTHAQPIMEDRPVSVGEELRFKLSYGWFTIGKGTFRIADDYVIKNGRKCLKIDVEGGTAGLAGIFSTVDDHWGALVDHESFLPYYSYRDLSEGNYELDEEVHFDYASNQVIFNQTYPKEEKPRPTRYFELEGDNIYDMMGGLMYARSIDYESLENGDTIRLDAFFDKKFYDFEMIYHGVEEINSKVGSIRCHKVIPIMEKNSVFIGDDAITFWVSADANRLPLKVSAAMKFGTAYCELTGYKNVKSGIDFE